VANHVHLVNAVRAGVVDQAVLEISAPEAEIRFVPATAAEKAYRQFSAGARRAVAGAPQMLFLIALILCARSKREFIAIVAAFAAGQIAVTAFAAGLSGISPRFVETAAALAVAYLAVEILFLPESRHRWMVVAVLGALQGLTYAAVVSASSFSPFWVLLGALFVAIPALTIGRVAWSLLPKQPTRIVAAIVLAASCAWVGWVLFSALGQAGA
jgi:putative Ca2+/H+ antiporter (TMEM165/GDT1 family)